MLVHADTFSRYGAGPDVSYMLNGLWAEVGRADIVNDPDGVSTGKAIVFGGNLNSSGYARFVLPNLNATSGISCRLWVDALSSAPGDNSAIPMIWWNDAGTRLAEVRFTATGRAVLYYAGVVIATSANPVITANAWWHLEAKFVFASGSGATFELRREGVPVLTASGFTTALYPHSAGFGASRFGTTGGVACYYKDLVIWDGTGSYNKDFMGAVVVYDLLPTADVDIGGWTSTAANGYSVLDNNPPSDSAYISAAYPVPSPCEFSFSDLPSNITSVKGLITRIRAAKVDGGDGQLQVSVVSDASEQAGSDRPITVAQTYYQDVFEVDPATSSPWVPLAVADVSIKLDRTV